ncbi:MAG TPA: DciA family protein [Phycisphaerales bacterium]|nr:DciA family protein [Phycisphaerales bacterium]
MDRTTDVAAAIERLRQSRVKTPPASEASASFSAMGRQLERSSRRLGSIAEAWLEVCPAGLVERTSVKSFVSGTLTIGVRDAATRFELDRVLRTGMERELVRRTPSTLRSVKVVIEAPVDAGTS